MPDSAAANPPPFTGGLWTLLVSRRRVASAAMAFSCIVNLLWLTGPIFMMEIYDRAVPSRSIPTLTALLVIALGLYAFQGLLDVLRSRIFARVGAGMALECSDRIMAVQLALPLRTRLAADALQPSRDLEIVRSFLSGSGPAALFDLPWMPVYLALCFAFHPTIGWLAAGGMAVLAGLTALGDLWTRSLTRSATELAVARNRFGEGACRNAEAVRAMGMTGRTCLTWRRHNTRWQEADLNGTDIAGMLSGISRMLRLMLQSVVMAVGVSLVIGGEISPGMIIASSLFVTRALAPAEAAIANWRSLLAATQAGRRLKEVFALAPVEGARTALPAPCKALAVEGLAVLPPGERRLVVHNVSFMVQAGQAIGIVGPSASGKSSLARALVGVWTPQAGRVRLDGASLDQWPNADLGRHLGYLPQDVQLFAGTIAQNIARFDPAAEDQTIVAAAEAAGVHNLILRLPDGYETEIGDNGAGLSTGQRQRIALARAVYDDPFLVVLDEPNANLDAEGEEALARAIRGIRERGGIAVVIAHRPSVLAELDLILVMANGQAKAFGPSEKVLPHIPQRGQAQHPPLRLVDAEVAAP